MREQLPYTEFTILMHGGVSMGWGIIGVGALLAPRMWAVSLLLANV
jgi:hypothetical protein